jgi:predicted NAD/FAD-binding protein
MDADEIVLNDIWRLAIGGAFAVLNAPGAGFPGRIYENTLVHELRKPGSPSSSGVALQ